MHSRRFAIVSVCECESVFSLVSVCWLGKSDNANNKQKPQQNESKINVKHVWTYVPSYSHTHTHIHLAREICMSTVAHRSIYMALYLSHVTLQLLEPMHWNALNLLIYHLIVKHNYWWFVSAFVDCSIFMLVSLFIQDCCRFLPSTNRLASDRFNL